MRTLLVLVALVSTGCAVNVAPMIAPTAPRVCTDRLPPKLFLNPACQNGVCGYTCEPGRWPPPVMITEAPPAPVDRRPYDGRAYTVQP